VAAAGIIGFGAGIAVGAMMSGGGGCCSWGYSSFAKAVGYANAGDKPQAFVGYYFKFLPKQGAGATGEAKDFTVNGKMTGGFAVVAYPAEYRNSGIMTFIVGKDGVVYQKNLGEKTAEIAQAMTRYDPADGWKPAF
jgi:hypothetical protein